MISNAKEVDDISIYFTKMIYSWNYLG